MDKVEELLRVAEDEAPGVMGEEGASLFHSGIVAQESRLSAKVASEFAELEQVCFHTIQG